MVSNETNLDYQTDFVNETIAFDIEYENLTSLDCEFLIDYLNKSTEGTIQPPDFIADINEPTSTVPKPKSANPSESKPNKIKPLKLKRGQAFQTQLDTKQPEELIALGIAKLRERQTNSNVSLSKETLKEIKSILNEVLNKETTQPKKYEWNIQNTISEDFDKAVFGYDLEE